MTKLQARQKTGDILAQIDDLIDSVNKSSARMHFERLLPTCEIGDEIAERFIQAGFPYPIASDRESRDEVIARWNTIGRQSELIYCVDKDCECKTDDLRSKDDIPGLSKPHILDDEEFEEFRCADRELSENDADALSYMINFMGADYVRLSIDYDGLAIDLDEFHAPYDKNGWD